MKRWVLFSVLAFLLVLFISCRRQENEKASEPEKTQLTQKVAPVAESLESMMDSALTNFQKGEVAKGVGLLLDGILLVKPRDNWPDGFVNSIFLAKEHIQSGNLPMFSEDISDALSLLQPPIDAPGEKTEETASDTEKPHQEAEPAPVAQIFASMISSAKDKFREGYADSGVIKILQALQLLTPRTN